MTVRFDAIRHRLVLDNQRMAETLAMIDAIASSSTSTDALATIGKLARAALIAKEPENPTLRHPQAHPEHEGAKS